MKNNFILWAVIWALGFILVNCYFAEKHIPKWKQKYSVLKSFIEDTGIADEEWLNR